jgi:hypothetical protein
MGSQFVQVSDKIKRVCIVNLSNVAYMIQNPEGEWGVRFLGPSEAMLSLDQTNAEKLIAQMPGRESKSSI